MAIKGNKTSIVTGEGLHIVADYHFNVWNKKNIKIIINIKINKIQIITMTILIKENNL